MSRRCLHTTSWVSLGPAELRKALAAYCFQGQCPLVFRKAVVWWWSTGLQFEFCHVIQNKWLLLSEPHFPLL